MLAVNRLWHVFLVVLLLPCIGTGCVTHADQPQPVQGKKGDLVRQRDLLEFRNHFRQLGLAYVTFMTSEGKAPTKKEDLAGQLQNAKKIIDMLDKGDIVFYYGVRPEQMTKGPGSTVLAHEAYQDNRGRRLVVMGDGSVREMSSEDFAKAPRAKN